MAFTAATSQALVQATWEKLTQGKLQMEQYMLDNNPALLAQTITALAAVTTAITNVNA